MEAEEMVITLRLRFSEALQHPEEVPRRVLTALEKLRRTAGLVGDDEPEAYTESIVVEHAGTRLECDGN